MPILKEPEENLIKRLKPDQSGLYAAVSLDMLGTKQVYCGSTQMRQIFFCHISKTAGTSLSQALENSFSADQVRPTRAAISANGGKYPGADTFLDELHGVRLVRGHYHLSFREWLDNPISLLVLRDPLERAQSHIKHIIRQTPEKKDKMLQNLERGRSPAPDNVMTRMIGGHLNEINAPDLLAAQRQIISRPIIEKSNLLRSATKALATVEILGFTSRLAELSCKLEELNISFDPQLYTNKTDKFELSSAQIETLKKDNELDQELYDFAQSF